MINRVAKKRTVCEVLREINDLHQKDSKHDKEIRFKLAEAEYMAKRMSKKLLELQPDIFDEGWWKKNKDFMADVDKRTDELYKIVMRPEEQEKLMRRNEYIEFGEKIPSLGNGGIGIKKELVEYASLVPNDQAIIELGPWLGSATSFLSIGSMFGNNAIIHSYDMWVSSPVYTQRALGHHGLKLEVGQDLYPIFAKNLEKFKNIVPHKMSIFDIKWNGPKIGLIVIDMGNGKAHTDQVFDAFEDYFIQGETIIFMMDFYFCERKQRVFQYQYDLVKANKKVFEFIGQPKRSMTGIFRYLGGKIKFVDGDSATYGINKTYPDLNEGLTPK